MSLTQNYLDKDGKILEIGCNSGRNLDFLYKHGYKNLNGIEINNDAVKLMKQEFPEMTSCSSIHEGSVESIIPEMKSRSYDLVYTMAVFEHIHSDSNFIFEEVARIADKYIITIEDEKTTWSWRHFPRNYKEIFENTNDNKWEQIYEYNCKDFLDDRFFARVFKRSD